MADRIWKHDRTQGLEVHWHGKNEVVKELTLDSNCLTEWDLVPVNMEKRGKQSKWVILETTDLGEALEIGQPYNPNTFQPVDNKAFLNMIKESISGTPHVITSCGSLRNRARVFLSIKLMGMEKFKAAGRDFGAFLNFGNGHDKSSVLWVNTSNICTVCDNTFTCNLVSVENKVKKTFGNNEPEEESDDIRISQRHTKNVKLRLPDIAKLVDKAIGVQGEFKLEMDKLAAMDCTETGARNLFAGFLGRKITKEARKNGLSTRAFNTVETLTTLFSRGKGNLGQDLADVFSAATDYYTHSSSGGTNIERQIVSSDYGAGNLAKQDFWSIVTDGERRLEVAAVGDELLTNTK